MSDGADRESRTEEATEKRLSEAIEKGNVPFAREAVNFGSFLALAIVCTLFAAWMARDVTLVLRGLYTNAGSVRLDDREAAATLLVAAGYALAATVMPVLAILAGGGILTSLLQNVPSAATDRIAPKLSRISPSAGWQRIYGKSGFIEFGKSLLKLIAVAVVTYISIRNHLGDFVSALQTDPLLLPQRVLGMVTGIVVPLTLFALLLALFDVTWSRLKWRHGLRMTRHDIKEEMKQAEGDPHIKARIRAIARQRSSRRMLDKLPKATMVIVNPTHYAVALRYARGESGAPVVLAKGVDFLALRMREIAILHDIPLIEDKPLARSLYGAVDIGAQIPAEFYRAVAEILHYLNSRRRVPMPNIPR